MGGVEPPSVNPSLLPDHSHSTPSYSPVILRVQEVGAGIACPSRSLQDARQARRRDLSRSTDVCHLSTTRPAACYAKGQPVSRFPYRCRGSDGAGTDVRSPDSPYAWTSSRSAPW